MGSGKIRIEDLQAALTEWDQGYDVPVYDGLADDEPYTGIYDGKN